MSKSCNLKNNIEAVNSHNIDESKYNAIVGTESLPLYDAEGNVIKKGRVYIKNFNDKKEAEAYIKNSYKKLVEKYNADLEKANENLKEGLKKYEEALYEKGDVKIETESLLTEPDPYQEDTTYDSIVEQTRKEIENRKRKRQFSAAVQKIKRKSAEKIKKAKENIGAKGKFDSNYKIINGNLYYNYELVENPENLNIRDLFNIHMQRRAEKEILEFRRDEINELVDQISSDNTPAETFNILHQLNEIVKSGAYFNLTQMDALRKIVDILKQDNYTSNDNFIGKEPDENYTIREIEDDTVPVGVSFISKVLKPEVKRSNITIQYPSVIVTVGTKVDQERNSLIKEYNDAIDAGDQQSAVNAMVKINRYDNKFKKELEGKNADYIAAKYEKEINDFNDYEEKQSFIEQQLYVIFSEIGKLEALIEEGIEFTDDQLEFIRDNKKFALERSNADMANVFRKSKKKPVIENDNPENNNNNSGIEGLDEEIDIDPFEEFDDDDGLSEDNFPEEFGDEIEAIDDELFFEEGEIEEMPSVLNKVFLSDEIDVKKEIPFESSIINNKKLAGIRAKVESIKQLIERLEAELDLDDPEEKQIYDDFVNSTKTLFIVSNQLKPGSIVDGQIVDKPIVEAIKISYEDAVKLLTSPTENVGDVSLFMEDDPIEVEEPEDNLDETQIDSIDGYAHPLLGNGKNVVPTGDHFLRTNRLYKTVRSSEKVTIKGEEQERAFRIDTELTNIYENNENKFGFETVEDFISASRKVLDGIKNKVGSKGNSEKIQIGFIKARKRVKLTYPRGKKLNIIEVNGDYGYAEVLLMGAVNEDGSFSPIGEIEYYDGFYDSNGNSYKENAPVDPRYKENYKEAYRAIKDLWDSTSYDKVNIPSDFSYEYNAQKINIKEENSRIKLKELVDLGYKDVYFMDGNKLFKYEKGNLEEVSNSKIYNSLNAIKDRSKLKQNSLFFVKIHGKYEPLPFIKKQVSDKNVEIFNEKISKIFELNNIDEISKLDGVHKSLKVNNSALLDITEFSFPLFLQNTRSIGMQKFNIKLSPKGNVYIEHTIGDDSNKVNFIIYFNKASGKFVFTYKIPETGNKRQNEKSFDEFNAKQYFKYIKDQLNDIKKIKNNNNKQFQYYVGEFLNMIIASESPSSVVLANLPESSITININYANKNTAQQQASTLTKEELFQNIEEIPTKDIIINTLQERFSGTETDRNIGDFNLNSSNFIYTNGPIEIFEIENSGNKRSGTFFSNVLFDPETEKTYYVGKNQKGATTILDASDLESNKNKVSLLDPKTDLYKKLRDNVQNLTIGYVSGAIYNGSTNIITTNGKVLSITTGKFVYESNSESQLNTIDKYNIKAIEVIREQSPAEYEAPPAEKLSKEEIENNKEFEEFAATNDVPLTNKNKNTTETPSEVNPESIVDQLNNIYGKENENVKDGSDIDTNNPVYSIQDKRATQEDISEARKKLERIVPFAVSEMDPLMSNLVNDGTPIGAFYKNIIYLLNESQKYHEAFHGIFRSILTDEEVDTLLSEARKKYDSPSVEDINRLRNLTDRNKNLTLSQLTNLYYEEKLAEDFQQYMDKGESIWEKIWRKIKDIIDFFLGNQDYVYSLFRQIERGKYAKSEVRRNSPFAYQPPAFATLNTIRPNRFNNAQSYFMLPQHAKIITSLVAKEAYDAGIENSTTDDFRIYIRNVREVFNPLKWAKHLKNSKDPNMSSNLMIVLDMYNALAQEGEDMIMLDNNGKFVVYKNIKFAKDNIKSIIKEAKDLLKFYMAEDIDQNDNEQEELEEIGEPGEAFKKDSYKYGGFKSESKAVRNLIGIITYSRKLFPKLISNDPEFSGEIVMPVQAERLYNKILNITSGLEKEYILDVIREASDNDLEMRAFYDHIKDKIDYELSIGNNDIVVAENNMSDSPTYNLIIKTFYKTNHDYLHIKKDNQGNTNSYYPNKFTFSNNIIKNWQASYNRSGSTKDQRVKNFNSFKEKMMPEEPYDISSTLFSEMMKQASKNLFDATGIMLTPMFLKYSYIKNNEEVSGFDNLKIQPLNIIGFKRIGSKLDSPSSIFEDPIVKEAARSVAYFQEDQITFMIKNPENESIFTSLYNSYDTELYNIINRSFVNGEFDMDLLIKNVRNLGYSESFLNRFLNMVSLNPIFKQQGLSEDDFRIIYAFGEEKSSYNNLSDIRRIRYKIKSYLFPPYDIEAKRSAGKKANRRLFNPFIIEAKNTSKLFQFEDYADDISVTNNVYSIGDKTLKALEDLYQIEKDSVDRYYKDIDVLKTGTSDNPVQFDSLVLNYHYTKLSDGTKVIFDGQDYYSLTEIRDYKKYQSHSVLLGYAATKLDGKPSGYKQTKGGSLFNFVGIKENYNGDLREWVIDQYKNSELKPVIKETISSSYSQDNKPSVEKIENTAFQFYVNDLLASASVQYLMYGGSPTMNHKDFIDITKRNAGLNANGSSIGNSKTNFAIIESTELQIEDEYIKRNNKDNVQDVQDAQNYGTTLWYFSKYAKYRGASSEGGQLRKIALKVIAGIKLNSDEIRLLEKNNMLLTDRKIVVRDTYLYDKTSVHIQAREKTSKIKPGILESEVLEAWEEYLSSPSPEAYNRIIMPMYKAKQGFEYHHDMLNSMEAQGIDIVMVTSASKNASQNVATSPKDLQGFIVDDRFIHEQVRTDNIKKKITDPTQSLALNASEHSEEFQKYADKFLDAQAERMLLASNIKIDEFFPNGKPDYEKMWNKIKDSISVTDPQLYELLDVRDGIPMYNWNIPSVNSKVLAAFNSAISNGSLKQKVKGSKLNLVSHYGHGEDLNWKVTDDRYPGVFFSEVYVSQYFLDKMEMSVGDVMWGTRIPTQDKHSMGNLKIKGVIEGPYGMSIMLPKELLFLSGADHDLDSLYVKTFHNKYSIDVINMLSDKDKSISQIHDYIMYNNPEMDSLEVLNDLMLMSQIFVTHNVGNQNIYATRASLDALKDSKVKRQNKPINSSILFDDRNNSESSNYISKGGIGSPSVFNVVYQKLVKYFPETFGYKNIEGKRINDLISTHVSGMTDDPKEQLMSGYGFNKNNINKVIAIMIAGDLTYDEAVTAIRDELFTFGDAESKLDFIKSKLSGNINRYIEGTTEERQEIKDLRSDGYEIEFDSNNNISKMMLAGFKNKMRNKSVTFDEIIEEAEEITSIAFSIGQIIRINRNLPGTSKEYFELIDVLESNGISIEKESHDFKTEGYNEGIKVIRDSNRYKGARIQRFALKHNKVYVNKGNKVIVYTLNHADNKISEMIYKIIIEDNITMNQLASYLTIGEMGSSVFVKYTDIFRKLSKKVSSKIDNQIRNSYQSVIPESLLKSLIKISENVDEFILAGLNGTAFLKDNQKKLYSEVMYGTLKNGNGYLEEISKKIIKESDEEIRLLTDIKYQSTEVTELVNGKQVNRKRHIATLMTANDETGYLRTLYSNDYSNMVNATDNIGIRDEFIKAVDKQEFIDNMSLADAKKLMTMLMFEYAMIKDGLMFNATTFAKIIDPRYFMMYGRSAMNVQKAFQSESAFSEYYENLDIDGTLDKIAKFIYRGIYAYANSGESRFFKLLENYQYTNKEEVPAKFFFASSGLGKTSLINNSKDAGNDLYADMDEILEQTVKEVTGQNKTLGTRHNSMLFSFDESYTEGSRMFIEIARNYRLDKAGIINLSNQIRKAFIEKVKNEYSGKIIFSTIKPNSMKRIGVSYDKFYIPDEGSIKNITSRISKRKTNPYQITAKKYKELYYDPYVGENNVVVVKNNLQDTIENEKESLFNAADSKKITVSFKNKKYIVIGESVFNEAMKEETNKKLIEYILAKRDFQIGERSLVSAGVMQFLSKKGGNAYDIKNQKYISREEFVDIINELREKVEISYKTFGEENKVINNKTNEIYNELGGQTIRGNVIIDKVAGRKPAVKSKTSKPIVAYRTRGNNFLEALEKDNAIGNPWSRAGYSLYKTNTVKESVEEFIAWMTGERHTDKLQDYRQAIINKIPDFKGKDIIYYKELNEPSHATALDYLINDYKFEGTQVPIQSDQTLPKSKKYELFPGVYANEGQQQALDKITNFLQDPSRELFLLKGRGGTGKTTIIRKALEQFKNKKIIGMAVSHDATSVLERAFGNENYSTRTIASALAMENVYIKNKSYFVPKSDEKLMKERRSRPISDMDIIIVDEASMIDKEYYKYIMEHKKYGAKVIFIGDNVQIGPINNDGSSDDSPVWKLLEEEDNYAELFEIMRQVGDNPIIEYTFKVANNVENMQNNKPFEIKPLMGLESKKGKDGEVVMTSNLKEMINDAIEIFKTSKDINEAIIIAFKNIVVNKINNDVIKELFKKELEKNPDMVFAKGMRVRASNSVLGENNEIVIENGLRGVISDFRKLQSTVNENGEKVTIAKSTTGRDVEIYGVDVYEIQFEYETFNKKTNKVIKAKSPIVNVINPSDYNTYYQLNIKRFEDKAKINNSWKIDYYPRLDILKETILLLQYNYATTSHKVQGSTYNTAFVHADDIDSSPEGNERKQRMLYTSMSRPRKKLVIYSQDNRRFTDQRTGTKVNVNPNQEPPLPAPPPEGIEQMYDQGPDFNPKTNANKVKELFEKNKNIIFELYGKEVGLDVLEAAVRKHGFEKVEKRIKNRC